ncbi:MAG: aldehyde-activating protein [Pseudomonadota bacterium]
MTGECSCGSVRVTIDQPPAYINQCNCSLCDRAGAAWGYFATASVEVVGTTRSFERDDRLRPSVAVHQCEECGDTTHFALTDTFKAENPSADQMGVNMKLFRDDDLLGIEVRFPDGRGWSGDGPFGHFREAVVISGEPPWAS